MRGIALGVLAATGQAVGLVFSKRGMGDALDPFSATVIRVFVGAILFSLLFTFIRRWPRVRAGLRDRRGLWFTAGGAFFGPFLGVSLSLLAVKHTETGVAATIMSLLPVTMIPAVIYLKKERVSWRGYVGAFLAVCGVAMMFLD
jgi:drug/metabolite transporter (DMT)-like permease